MGGYGRNDDGDRGISSQDRYMDCGDDREEVIRQGMGVGIGILRIEYHRYLANKGVRKESKSDNSGIYNRETNIQTLYSCRADRGF